jgi:hypothetical protein
MWGSRGYGDNIRTIPSLQTTSVQIRNLNVEVEIELPSPLFRLPRLRNSRILAADNLQYPKRIDEE